MGRFANSWTVFKESLDVLKKDKELLVLPILSGMASILIVLSFWFPVESSGLMEKVDAGDQNSQFVAGAIALGVYLILSFITIYFQTALVCGANERLAGGDPTVGSAIRGANARLGKIFLWSLFAATVSLLIHLIQAALRRSNNNLAASLFGWIFGTAWALATFFVIPVVAFENLSPFAAIKRSAQLFKQRWGESLIGEWGIGAAMGLLWFLSFAIFFLIFFFVAMPAGSAVVIPLIVVAVLWFIFLSVLHQTLGGIYKTALYRFANNGQSVPYFTPAAIEGAYHPTYTSANRL